MLIGISGAAGAGKSTAAIYLTKNHGFVRKRFAGPLKAMMQALGLTEDQVDGDQKAEPLDLLGGKTPRQAMQFLGTEWGRQLVVDDLWIRAWRASLPAQGNIVVDDVRFQNEVDEIKTRGGVIVHLTGRGGISGSHVSEGFIPDGAAHIDNSGPPQAMFYAFENLLWRMSKPYQVAA